MTEEKNENEPFSSTSIDKYYLLIEKENDPLSSTSIDLYHLRTEDQIKSFLIGVNIKNIITNIFFYLDQNKKISLKYISKILSNEIKEKVKLEEFIGYLKISFLTTIKDKETTEQITDLKSNSKETISWIEHSPKTSYEHYRSFNLKILILNSLNIHTLRDMPREKTIMNRNQKVFDPLYLILIVLIYSDVTNEEKVGYLYDLLSLNGSVKIQSHSNLYRNNLKKLIFISLYFADSVSNYILAKLTKDEIEAILMDPESSNSTQYFLVKLMKTECFDFKKILFYLKESEDTIRDFVNYISQNFVFFESTNDSNRVIDKQTFANLLKQKNYSLLKPSEIRLYARKFMKWEGEKAYFFMEQFNKLIKIFENRHFSNKPLFNENRPTNKLIDEIDDKLTKAKIKDLNVAGNFCKYISILKDKNLYEFLKWNKKYNEKKNYNIIFQNKKPTTKMLRQTTLNRKIEISTNYSASQTNTLLRRSVTKIDPSFFLFDHKKNEENLRKSFPLRFKSTMKIRPSIEISEENEGFHKESYDKFKQEIQEKKRNSQLFNSLPTIIKKLEKNNLLKDDEILENEHEEKGSVHETKIDYRDEYSRNEKEKIPEEDSKAHNIFDFEINDDLPNSIPKKGIQINENDKLIQLNSESNNEPSKENNSNIIDKSCEVKKLVQKNPIISQLENNNNKEEKKPQDNIEPVYVNKEEQEQAYETKEVFENNPKEKIKATIDDKKTEVDLQNIILQEFNNVKSQSNNKKESVVSSTIPKMQSSKENIILGDEAKINKSEETKEKAKYYEEANISKATASKLREVDIDNPSQDSLYKIPQYDKNHRNKTETNLDRVNYNSFDDFNKSALNNSLNPILPNRTEQKRPINLTENHYQIEKETNIPVRESMQRENDIFAITTGKNKLLASQNSNFKGDEKYSENLFQDFSQFVANDVNIESPIKKEKPKEKIFFQESSPNEFDDDLDKENPKYHDLSIIECKDNYNSDTESVYKFNRIFEHDKYSMINSKLFFKDENFLSERKSNNEREKILEDVNENRPSNLEYMFDADHNNNLAFKLTKNIDEDNINLHDIYNKYFILIKNKNLIEKYQTTEMQFNKINQKNLQAKLKKLSEYYQFSLPSKEEVDLIKDYKVNQKIIDLYLTILDEYNKFLNNNGVISKKVEFKPIQFYHNIQTVSEENIETFIENNRSFIELLEDLDSLSIVVPINFENPDQHKKYSQNWFLAELIFKDKMIKLYDPAHNLNIDAEISKTKLI
jgi:hypothetical protein